MKVTPAQPIEFLWLSTRLGCPITSDWCAIKAVDATGKIRGMVAFYEWTETSVRAHMAVDSAIVWRSLLRPAFTYPFLEAGREVLLGSIVGSNAESLRFAKRIGFREVHRIADGHSKGVDVHIIEMRKGECPWLEAKREAA